LEEPPSTVRFYLLAESAKAIIPTIRSRCGMVLYRRLSEPFVISVLQRFEPDPGKALVYARIAEGSVGRAVQFWGSGRLSLRDRVLSLVKHGLNKDIASLFSTVDQIGTSLPLGLRFLEQLLLDLRIVRTDPSSIINIDIATELGQMAGSFRVEMWYELVSGLKLVRARYQTSHIVLPFHVKSFLAAAFVGG